MKKFIHLPWYPFLLAADAVLALLATNVTEVKFSAAVRPLALTCLAAGLLFLLLRLAYRSAARAGFAAAAWVLLLSTYGPVYDTISAKRKFPHFTAWMLAVWLLLAVLALVLAGLRRLHFDNAAVPLNLISLGLVVYSLVPVVSWNVTQAFAAPPVPAAADPAIDLPAAGRLPDIYYLIPEDYGRADLLQRQDGIDTSRFVQFLESSGFYLAACSQSNYVSSELSLGSSLNMDYLQNLGPGFKADSIDQGPIWNALRANAVSADLEQAGYTTVAFATGFSWSELDNADVYIGPSPFWSGMTGFESLLLRATPARQLEDLGALNLDAIDWERYRERTLLDFASAARLAALPGPKFVFMQIIAPHPPFVFAVGGAPTDPGTFLTPDRLYTQAMYTQGFRDEVPFVDTMLARVITTLIAKATRPLVIVVQADTGPWFTNGSDQFKILNAYYMPGHTARLYPGISPVNTFRVVLDEYLGADLPLVPDVSYFSPVPDIYNFSQVPNSCRVK